jgi:hypothetical protein
MSDLIVELDEVEDNRGDNDDHGDRESLRTGEEQVAPMLTPIVAVLVTAAVSLIVLFRAPADDTPAPDVIPGIGIRSTPIAPGASTDASAKSAAAITPTPLTIYSGQPCLDFSAVGRTSCTGSGGVGEITADFAVTSHCGGRETIETIFAYEVSTRGLNEVGLASWDPIRDISIEPGQTVNVQHKLSKVLPERDTYHFRLVILNQKGPLKAEFTTDDAPICYQQPAR